MLKVSFIRIDISNNQNIMLGSVKLTPKGTFLIVKICSWNPENFGCLRTTGIVKHFRRNKLPYQKRTDATGKL